MVSVLRICLNFLQTSATLGNTVPGSKENISTRSSGGSSINDSGCGGLVFDSPLLTWPLPYSQASLGPAVAASAAATRPGPPLLPASLLRWPTIRSSSSSSISESLPWSCWSFLCRLRRHLRDCPTPQSLAQTAIRSQQTAKLHHYNTYISCGHIFLSSRA